MRRPSGEAAEIILRAVSEAHPEGLTIAGLSTQAGLPERTVRANVTALRKLGKIVVHRDDKRVHWICLSD